MDQLLADSKFAEVSQRARNLHQLLLEMPVEPTEKNFKQFEKENSFIHLNMYAEDDERCPITPLYVE